MKINLYIKRISLLVLFIFKTYFSFAQNTLTEKTADQFFYHGKSWEAIQNYNNLLPQVNDRFAKARLFNKIAECYYATNYIEEFKQYADSAHKYNSNFYKEENVFDVEYQLSLMRYQNFYINPKVSYSISLKVRQLLKKYWQDSDKIKLHKVYETIGTLYRNYGGDYTEMQNVFDSTYVVLQTQQLVTPYDLVFYYKARANMNLDLIKPNENPMYLNEAIRLYDMCLKTIKSNYPKNKPFITTVWCLKGLAYHMAGKYNEANAMYNTAFEVSKAFKSNNYSNEDFESIMLNLTNWSEWTIDKLFERDKDIKHKYNQLEKLKQVVNIYQQYANRARRNDINLFTDKYHYAPYNSIVVCYYDIYNQTKDENLIDSALFYLEKNKTQYSKSVNTFAELKTLTDGFVKNNNVIISYSQTGFQNQFKIHAIVVSKGKKQFIRLIDFDKYYDFPMGYDYPTSSYEEYARFTYNYYQKLVYPLEKYLPENTNKILLIPSGSFSYLSFESITTDTTAKLSQLPFLFFNYNIIQQPSITCALGKNKQAKKYNNNISLFCPDYNKSEYSNIKFTRQLFYNFAKNKAFEDFNFNQKCNNLLFVSAHCKSDFNSIDNSYIALPDSNLSISEICNSSIQNQLAVLAMCDAGNGQNISGASNFSFSSAFLMAGAESCLFNIWKQDDKTASVLLGYFLENLTSGQAKDDALRNAKINYLKNAKSTEELNPIYWAGLQITGNLEPIEVTNINTPSFFSKYWYLFIGILVIILGVFLKIK